MISLYTVATLLDSVSAAAPALHRSVAQKVAFHTERIKSTFDGTLNSLNYAALLVSAADNDTYIFKNMLRQPDVKDFLQAMMQEMDAHEIRNHWTLTLRSDLPPGTKAILAIWLFKRKRFLDSRIQKYKAKICAYGGMQTWEQISMWMFTWSYHLVLYGGQFRFSYHQIE